ncbi:MAG: hypothetical protein ABSE93_09055 [Terriglobia bacterium]
MKELRTVVRGSTLRISDQVRFYIDGWMVSAFLSVSAVTHYAISSRLAITFMDVIIAVTGILSPWFSLLLGRNDHEAIRRVFSLGTKVSSSI